MTDTPAAEEIKRVGGPPAAARAVQFVFLFTLVAGLAVLYAAIASTQDERVYQATIMSTLGASRTQINRTED